MEKTTTAYSKEDPVVDSTPVTVEDNLVNEESENNVKDDVAESPVERIENDRFKTEPEKMPEEIAQDFPQEMGQGMAEEIPEEIHQELPQESPHEIPYPEKPQEIPEKIPEAVAEETPVTTEKRVSWQDHDIRSSYENLDVNNDKQTIEQTTKPIYVNNRPPLKETVIEIEDEESIAEEQSYNSMNPVLFDTPRNFEILKNPARQEIQVEPSTASSCTFSRKWIYVSSINFHFFV